MTESLLQAAKEEFLTYGFHDASMRRISAACGVSTNSIYTRFGDKSGLFTAIVQEAADGLMEMYMPVSYTHLDVYKRQLLAKTKHTAEDIAVFECNEAFAVIDELFARAYPEAVDHYNRYGGALAYGHPYGASGGIITIHACRALQETPGRCV